MTDLDVFYSYSLFHFILLNCNHDQYTDFMNHPQSKSTGLDEQYTDPTSKNLYSSWEMHMYITHRYLVVGKSLDIN